MNKTQQEFSNYVEQIIERTFGFVPLVQVEETENGMINVILDGSPLERSVMMGRDARNFQLIKGFLRIFARRQGYFSYLHIVPSDAHQANTRER